jgi:very-short-patch-repair endonuclease
MPQKFIVRGQKVTAEKISKAKEFRHNMTKAENTLWQSLRANRLGGWHFRRQQVLFGYIVGFYCHQASLVIEVDGDVHDSQRVADLQRDEALERNGFKVIRISNREIEHNLGTVLSIILKTCNQALPIYQDSPPLEWEGPRERSQGDIHESPISH